MSKALNNDVQELISQGGKPCPNCGVYCEPPKPNAKHWRCISCGADLTLSPEDAAKAAKARLSDTELVDQITALNNRARVMKVLSIVCMFSFTFLALIGGVALGVLGFIGIAVFALLSFGANSEAKRLMANNLTRNMLSEVFDDCVYNPWARLPDELLREIELVPNWDKAIGSDLISAKYKGHRIKFSDINLLKEYKYTDSDGDEETNHRSVFKGHWMVLELERKVPAKLCLKENAERGESINNQVSERVGNESEIITENEKFNRRFQIFSDDAQSAFRILTPNFMEIILHAADTVNTQIFFGFVENRIHIVCHTGKDSLEIPKYKGVNLEQIRAHLRRELEYITSLADDLLKSAYLIGIAEQGERNG